MTITAEPTNLEIELVPPDPWAAGWSPPERGDVSDRHDWVRRQQDEGWIPSQGGSRNRVGEPAPPEPSSEGSRPKPVVHQSNRLPEEQPSARRRRLRAFRIAIATTAIGLVVAAAAAYWYFAVLNG